MLSARMIGYAIREARTARGLTQRQLAQAAGVSERMLVALELGDNAGVRLDKLQAVLAPLSLELSIAAVGASGASSPVTPATPASGASYDATNIQLPTQMTASAAVAWEVLTTGNLDGAADNLLAAIAQDKSAHNDGYPRWRHQNDA